MMTISISDAAQNAACNGIVDLVDGGATNGEIEIRTGSKPADPNDAATGTLLATVPCNDPAFGNSGASVVGQADLAGTLPLEDPTPVASGTAGWFRAMDSNGNAVFDGTVGVSGSGADMIVNTTTVTAGVPFRITSGSFTIPLQ
jgi:hypothetical protein